MEKIIEIYGMKLKEISDNGKSENCKECALDNYCSKENPLLCWTTDPCYARHFEKIENN